MDRQLFLSLRTTHSLSVWRFGCAFCEFLPLCCFSLFAAPRLFARSAASYSAAAECVLVDGQHHVTPLHLAADGNRFEVAEALLAAGGNPNAMSCVSVLHIAFSLSMFFMGLLLSPSCFKLIHVNLSLN